MDGNSASPSAPALLLLNRMQHQNQPNVNTQGVTHVARRRNIYFFYGAATCCCAGWLSPEDLPSLGTGVELSIALETRVW